MPAIPDGNGKALKSLVLYLAPVHKSLNIGKSFTIPHATTQRLRSLLSRSDPIILDLLIMHGVKTRVKFDSSFDIWTLDMRPLDKASNGRTESPSLDLTSLPRGYRCQSHACCLDANGQCSINRELASMIRFNPRAWICTLISAIAMEVFRVGSPYTGVTPSSAQAAVNSA